MCRRSAEALASKSDCHPDIIKTHNRSAPSCALSFSPRSVVLISWNSLPASPDLFRPLSRSWYPSLDPLRQTRAIISSTPGPYSDTLLHAPHNPSAPSWLLHVPLLASSGFPKHLTCSFAPLLASLYTILRNGTVCEQETEKMKTGKLATHRIRIRGQVKQRRLRETERTHALVCACVCARVRV